MFTDVAGYSARMGADEASTIRAVREHRVVLREALAAHGGREVETSGDAFFVLFDAAVDAVKCAIAMQRALAERNRSLPESERILVRIGINVGDVLRGEDGQNYGPALNIAARIEGIAPPGGACVTESVHAQVHHVIDEPFEPLGFVPLKNISRPPALYLLRLEATEAPKLPARPRTRRLSLATGATACVAVVATLALAWTMSQREVEGSLDVVASANPDAQAAYEESLGAFARGEARASRLATIASVKDPGSPRIWLLARMTAAGPGEQTRALNRAVALVRGRSDGTAELVRLVEAMDLEQGRGVQADHASQLSPQWDAWLAAHQGDTFGEFIRAAWYPVHGTETNFHEKDPAREHLTARELRRFIERHPDWPRARMALVDQLPPMKNDEALTVLREGLASCPECTPLRLVLAMRLLTAHDVGAARTEARRVLEEDASLTDDARMILAQAALLEGDEPERERLVAVLLAPDTPVTPRESFARGHARELTNRGRVREAMAIVDGIVATQLAEGRDDDAADLLLYVEDDLIDLDEIERLRAIDTRLDALLASPGISVIMRNRIAASALIAEASDGLVRNDGPAIRAVVEKIKQIPPERQDGINIDNLLRFPEAYASAFERKPLSPNIYLFNNCSERYWRAALYEKSGDPRIEDEIDEVLHTDLCRLDPPRWPFFAAMLMAERHLARGELEKAREHATLARSILPQADTDLRWMRRLAEVERKAAR